jgi:hypothetical protein
VSPIEDGTQVATSVFIRPALFEEARMATLHTRETETELDEEKERDHRLGPCASEIPTERWKPFLDEFSREHLDRMVNVEVRGTAAEGAQWLAENTPLIGLVAGDEPEGSIEIILGTSETGPVTHVVPQAVRLWEQHDEQGRQMLQIESADGATTVVKVLV